MGSDHPRLPRGVVVVQLMVVVIDIQTSMGRA
jgi:hypothetical protein